MWIKQLIEQGAYNVGDTLHLYLTQIKEIPSNKTDNGVFKTEMDETININIPQWTQLKEYTWYDVYIKRYDGKFVEVEFNEEKEVFTENSLEQLFHKEEETPSNKTYNDRFIGEEDYHRRARQWLIERERELEEELGTIHYLLGRYGE